MRAFLCEERPVPQLVHREVDKREEETDEDVSAQRSEHGLVRDPAMLERAADGHRRRGGHEQRPEAGR